MISRIRKVEVDRSGMATFYFEGSDESFSLSEFEIGSLTRKHLEFIEYEIQDFNSEVDVINDN